MWTPDAFTKEPNLVRMANSRAESKGYSYQVFWIALWISDMVELVFPMLLARVWRRFMVLTLSASR